MWYAAGRKPTSAPQCLPVRWLKLCMLLSDQTIKVNEMQIFVFKSYHTLAGKHYFKVNIYMYIYIYSANLYSLKEGDIYLHRRSRMSNRLTWRHSKIVVK